MFQPLKGTQRNGSIFLFLMSALEEFTPDALFLLHFPVFLYNIPLSLYHILSLSSPLFSALCQHLSLTLYPSPSQHCILQLTLCIVSVLVISLRSLALSGGILNHAGAALVLSNASFEMFPCACTRGLTHIHTRTPKHKHTCCKNHAHMMHTHTIAHNS